MAEERVDALIVGASFAGLAAAGALDGGMTKGMSVLGPLPGHEYHVHAGDEQLRLSADPGFVRELEAYQRQIDRMLARRP